MIDLAQENLITFKEVTRRLPKRPNGRRLHISAVYRWASKGTRGVILESIRIGGTTYTSVEAMQRFADALTATDKPATLRQSFSNRSREAQARQAARQVRAELGIDGPNRASSSPSESSITSHPIAPSVQEETAQVTDSTVVDASTAGKPSASESTQPKTQERFTA